MLDDALRRYILIHRPVMLEPNAVQEQAIPQRSKLQTEADVQAVSGHLWIGQQVSELVGLPSAFSSSKAG
jgi:hypothetical protein